MGMIKFENRYLFLHSLSVHNGYGFGQSSGSREKTESRTKTESHMSDRVKGVGFRNKAVLP